MDGALEHGARRAIFLRWPDAGFSCSAPMSPLGSGAESLTRSKSGLHYRR